MERQRREPQRSRRTVLYPPAHWDRSTLQPGPSLLESVEVTALREKSDKMKRPGPRIYKDALVIGTEQTEESVFSVNLKALCIGRRGGWKSHLAWMATIQLTHHWAPSPILNIFSNSTSWNLWVFCLCVCVVWMCMYVYMYVPCAQGN